MNEDLGNLWVILNAAVYFITFLLSLFLRNLLISFIILLYSIFAFSSVILYNYGVDTWNITLIPFIYLYVILIIIILPITKFNTKKIKIDCRILKNHFLYFISFISISGSILIFLNLDLNFDFLNQYNEKSINRTVSQEINFQKIYLIFPVISRYLGCFCIFILAYILCVAEIKNSKIKVLIQLYLIIVTLNISNYILISDRAGIFFNFCMITSAYLIFKKNIKIPKFLLIQVIFVFCVAILSFMYISIARFSNKEKIIKVENSTIYYLINYTGQSFLNFNDSVFYNKLYSYGDITLSSTRMLLGKKFSKDLTSYEYNWSAGRENRSSMSNFHTIIGVFCLDFGNYISFILLFFCSFLMYIILSKKNLYIDDLFLLFVYSFIICHGVILYRFYFFYGSLEFVFYILLYFYIKYKRKISYYKEKYV